MLNSMVMFSFSVLDRNYPFMATLVQKFKKCSLRWNLVPNSSMWNTVIILIFLLTTGNALVPIIKAITFFCLRIHRRLFTILKTSRRVYEVMLFDIWSIFWNCIQYTLHWNKTQTLKKLLSGNINGRKMHSFLSRVRTHHSLIFNLQFLYELKRKIPLAKSVWGVFPFWIPFRFYWNSYFCSKKSVDPAILKRHNSFQN